MSTPEHSTDRIALPHEPEVAAQDELEAFRATSFAERGRLLAVAFRAAVRLDLSRRRAGLPPLAADPWPESTWHLLKQQDARHGRR